MSEKHIAHEYAKRPDYDRMTHAIARDYVVLEAERDRLKLDYDEVNEGLHAARAAINATSEDISKCEIPCLLEERDTLRAERDALLINRQVLAEALERYRHDCYNEDAIETWMACRVNELREALGAAKGRDANG